MTFDLLNMVKMGEDTVKFGVPAMQKVSTYRNPCEAIAELTII